MIDLGDVVTGRLADESRWNRKYPPYAPDPQFPAFEGPTMRGTVTAVFPRAEGVVSVRTDQGTTVLLRDARKVPPRRVGCECPSGAYGGVCTC